MFKQILSLLILLSVSFYSFSQDIQGKWLSKTAKGDFIELKNGQFDIRFNGDSTVRSGDFLYQDSNLFFFSEEGPKTSRFSVTSLTDSSLQISGKQGDFSFSKHVVVRPLITENQLKPSEGISSMGILRGILGMLVLLAIAFLFSSNRRAINWKTVGIGMAAQLILAIGVLKVGFVQFAFEYVGGLFVLVLDFTRSGSEFLLGGMMDIESYGFIFLFQVLPTIIFFSALTSVSVLSWNHSKDCKTNGDHSDQTSSDFCA